MLDKLTRYPLLIAGVISLVSGIALNQYWGMLLGLLAMAYGGLKVTDSWG